jgi:prepilin-type N-terminal cleavage/methylation domain-containing protein
VLVNIKKPIKVTNASGFTLVELTLSLTVFAILSIGFLSITTTMFATIIRNSVHVNMTIDAQNFLRTVEENIRFAAGVRQTNEISDSNAPGGAWNTSDTNFVIIIAIPATDQAREYIIDPATDSPYMNELVYYRSGSSMLLRTLAHPSATDNIMRTSCPSETSTTSCPADRQLLENLNTITYEFYDQNDAPTADPLLARSVDIILQTSKDSFGEPLTLDNSVQVTLRNVF